MIGPDKGDGSLATAKALARELGVEDRVTWMAGGVPKREIAKWLARADLFLNTTDVDNAPVTTADTRVFVNRSRMARSLSAAASRMPRVIS